jgi:type 1 glutamine amidotransferase
MKRISVRLAIATALLGTLVMPLGSAPPDEQPAKIVLIAGTPSHLPLEHEFNNGILLLDKCLRQNKGVTTVVVKGGWPHDESVFDGASEIVFYMDGGDKHPIIQGDHLQKIGALVRKGVGIACMHYAVEVPATKGGDEFMEWIGGFYETGVSKNPINDVMVTQASPQHPISRGWKSFQTRDEWYFNIHFRPNDKRITPILTAMLPPDNPQKEVISWVVERADGGRGFGFDGGHFAKSWGNPDFRRLVVNALLWTAKVEVPKKGALCDITPEDLTQNMDEKPVKK